MTLQAPKHEPGQLLWLWKLGYCALTSTWNGIRTWNGMEWNGMELETKWHLVNNESLQGLGCDPSQLTYTPLEQYPLPNS